MSVYVLIRESVVAKNATTGSDGKIYQVEYFNLDVVISVGFRVKSKKGVQFRIWANGVLKNYLTEGYAIDKRRFQEQSRQLEELKQTVKLLGNVIESRQLNTDEATGLLRVVTDYAYALDVLDRYDHQVLEIEATSPKEHSFSDGNKRIAAFLFVWFLEKMGSYTGRTGLRR
jgi:hypothetical protein